MKAMMKYQIICLQYRAMLWRIHPGKTLHFREGEGRWRLNEIEPQIGCVSVDDQADRAAVFPLYQGLTKVSVRVAQGAE